MGTLDKVFAYRYKETQPLKLDKGAVIQTAEAAGAGLKLGMPEIGITQLANKILLEGRPDAGTNEYNYDNPRAKKLHDDLVAQGVTNGAAMYPAAVIDKSEVAKRLNIPFELAWNGTGKLVANGSDGNRHAARAESMKTADKDPRNADFVDLIKRAVNGNISGQERLTTKDSVETANLLFGPNAVTQNYDNSLKVDSKVESQLRDNINKTMDLLGYNEKQRSDVNYAIGTRYGSISGLVIGMADLYKEASGIPVDRPYYAAEDVNKSPAAKEVINVLLGVDPGGQLYKDAYARKNPEANSDGFFAKLFGK